MSLAPRTRERTGTSANVDQPGALGPLGGDEQDAEDRQQDGRRLQPDVEDGLERVVRRIADEQADDHDERGERHHGDLQPEAGPGVDHLAQLDGDEAAEAGARVHAGGVHADRCGEGGGAHAVVPSSSGWIESVCVDGVLAPGVVSSKKRRSRPAPWAGASRRSTTPSGAVPVFVDIEAATFNMDMELAAGVLKAHPKIKAVIPIHLFGGCADLDPLCAIARERGIFIIEDAAQSLGSEYKGRRAGSMGEVGCFSFYPTKNLGGYGEGGMLTTNDPEIRERLAALRVHGSRRKYYHDWVGINSRLDTLQAAVLRVKLRYLDSWSRSRAENAALYRQCLAANGVPVTPPAPAPYQTRHIYNQFSIVCARRDELQAYLKENGIGTEVYYPLPLHLQACFADLGYRAGDFPVSERLANESLALPIHSDLSAGDIEHVCRTIQAFYA